MFDISQIITSLITLIEDFSYLGIIFFMFIESSFVPFPSEIIMIPAGYLASQQKMSLLLIILSGVVGSLFGALFNYYLARTIGINIILKFGKYIFLNRRKIEKVEIYFKKHGCISTFVGRLIPGVRQLISIPAGIAKMNLKKFCLYTSLGAAIWVTILVIFGYIFGSNLELIKDNIILLKQIILLSSFLVIVTYIIYSRYNKRKTF